MTNAISIHIGLNRVDPAAYNGWDGQLSGCVNDALAMQRIADGLGYVSIPILNEEATADRIVSEIGQAALNLDSSGILLLTYSGHGGQMPDADGDEADGKDETWVLYDRQLIDDELLNLWNQFSSGARIVVLSDSCHSGTVTRAREYRELAQAGAFANHYRTRNGSSRFRAIPEEIARANYRQNKAAYDALQFASGSRKRGVMDACVLLISGCQDNQLSNDGDINGLFTGTLLEVWQNGGFAGNYRAFHQAILDQMPSTQTPNFYLVGARNPAFEEQQPFIVDTPPIAGANGQEYDDPWSPWPSIKAQSSVTRWSEPPVFQVNAGPGRYFAVELATASTLFDYTNHGSERNNGNFYGSWSDTALMKGRTYAVPPFVWQMLSNATRLYYRIGSTTNPQGWDDYAVSSADTDGDAIPSITINGWY